MTVGVCARFRAGGGAHPNNVGGAQESPPLTAASNPRLPVPDMADYRSEWLRLPSFWSHGVTRDGRIFFIDEEAHRTTWLHPATGEAVISGHRKTPDLPTGWEEGYTFEGARYYINHNEWKVTCKHPVTGHTSQENCIFVMNDDFRTAAAMASQEKKDRPVSVVSEVSTYTMASEMALLPMSPAGRFKI
ncbi:pleckstrin homology domain-containing family A member 5 isoform X14 [Stegostoma tigrinum]|uniref:pleckstrin homology domain-containing family A member 5 isoform X14 n=1 Tax=Stegostoma tigrinum TaxID=3053191 RepID=UPI0028706207|nr:pleckstrin homology domain-containing family A member 5 isoform X14 [Stegostoma tigrinum]